MNLHGLTQGANGGKGIARPELAGDHGFLRGEAHLFVHRDTGLERQPERDQGLSPCITGVLYHV
jgi:hypothetical protein